MLKHIVAQISALMVALMLMDVLGALLLLSIFHDICRRIYGALVFVSSSFGCELTSLFTVRITLDIYIHV